MIIKGGDTFHDTFDEVQRPFFCRLKFDDLLVTEDDLNEPDTITLGVILHAFRKWPTFSRGAVAKPRPVRETLVRNRFKNDLLPAFLTELYFARRNINLDRAKQINSLNADDV